MASEKHEKAKVAKHIPKDAQVICSILKEIGVTDYEPRVINQLLEFTYRYVTCTLDDAKLYANHAKKKIIDIKDVKLASQMLLDKAFTTPPPRDVLMDIARTKNNTPLPPIKAASGLRLPPDRYCLSACNYKLRAAMQPKKMVKPGFDPSKSLLKSSTMKKQTPLSTIPKTQNINIPKPVFKFSTKTATAKVKTQEILDQPSIEKMETDDIEVGLKRKREDDDFEIVT